MSSTRNRPDMWTRAHASKAAHANELRRGCRRKEPLHSDARSGRECGAVQRHYWALAGTISSSFFLENPRLSITSFIERLGCCWLRKTPRPASPAMSRASALPPHVWLWSGIVIVGGVIGSEVGSRRVAVTTFRRLLAVVLVVAGGKLLLL